jgi:hypothetical protein
MISVHRVFALSLQKIRTDHPTGIGTDTVRPSSPMRGSPASAYRRPIRSTQFAFIPAEMRADTISFYLLKRLAVV